jgi:protease I
MAARRILMLVGDLVEDDEVTAPAWPAHPQWLAVFLKVLGTRIEHCD